MGKYLDFIVNYNDDPEVMGNDIIKSITVSRLNAHKPCIIFVSGDSGEGKSYGGLKILDIINTHYGIDTLDKLDDSVIYIPTEYLTKLDNCLFWKRKNRPDLENLRVLMIDEAREVVKAKLWHTFINQAIADCSAMSRSVKEIVLLVVSQFIKDIDSAIRYTINYYAECQRPLHGSTHLKIEKVWKNTYDLERPKLSKRPIIGYIDYGNVRSQFKPWFQIHLPPKEIRKKYDEMSYTSKSKILRKRIETTLNRLQKEIGHEFDKVEQLVKYYMENPEQQKMIKDPRFRQFHLRKEFKEMHDLTNVEVKEFQKRFQEEQTKLGMIRIDDEENDSNGSE